MHIQQTSIHHSYLNTAFYIKGTISAAGQGYSGNQGPGVGASSYKNTYGSTGGGHGGRGGPPVSGLDSSLAYDDYSNPTMHGSGGGNGGSGGGMCCTIRIITEKYASGLKGVALIQKYFIFGHRRNNPMPIFTVPCHVTIIVTIIHTFVLFFIHL